MKLQGGGVMDGKMFDISSYIVHSNPETGSMKTVCETGRKAMKVGGRGWLQSLSYTTLDQRK